jgi:hypothetical protein
MSQHTSERSELDENDIVAIVKRYSIVLTGKVEPYINAIDLSVKIFDLKKHFELATLLIMKSLYNSPWKSLFEYLKCEFLYWNGESKRYLRSLHECVWMLLPWQLLIL